MHADRHSSSPSPRATEVKADLDKARTSNEGDEFHVVWTARRALRLLDPASNLVAVAVEGIDPLEVPNTDRAGKGLLKVDTAEYYGSERFSDAERVAYVQHKYSPTARGKHWTAGGVADTVAGFAQIFKARCSEFGQLAVIAKARFHFITNRPIAAPLAVALQSAREGRPAEGRKACHALARLRRAAALPDDQFRAFVALLDLDGGEDGRAIQEYELGRGISRYLPGIDALAPLRLQGLVRSRALLDGSREPIRRHVTAHGAGQAARMGWPARARAMA